MIDKQPIVKICCIQNIKEAFLAISYGVHALGFVSKMPSGPGPISENKIAKIVSGIPPGIATFLLTSNTESEKIINQQKFCRTNTIQLVDFVKSNVHRELKENLPGVKIVQVIHVKDRSSLDYALEVYQFVDGILLDSGNQNLEIKELGGTGRTHDWNISKEICKKVSVPVFLAGGLNSGNIGQAIKAVNPFGVDVCSGVRTNNKLDEKKLSQFMKCIIKPSLKF